jgi:hypothetical protein
MAMTAPLAIPGPRARPGHVAGPTLAGRIAQVLARLLLRPLAPGVVGVGAVMPGRVDLLLALVNHPTLSPQGLIRWGYGFHGVLPS